MERESGKRNGQGNGRENGQENHQENGEQRMERTTKKEHSPRFRGTKEMVALTDQMRRMLSSTTFLFMYVS